MRPCFAAFAGLAIAAAAHGAVIVNGTYQLHNHPDGAARPPLYGMRLDELYNATAGHDVFTFNFDHAMSNMRMDVTNTTIRIYGVTWGGRDTGGSYAADAYAGLYTIDFTYAIGVANKPSDDDRWVKYSPDMQNAGSILTPLGHTIALRDKSNGTYQFRLGDEDNDLGHRGFAGISGWGWLNHGPAGSPHIDSSDWLFTATLIPSQGALALMGLGGLVASRRKR